jgi:cell wall-associated NlpC family hydrolase
MPIRWASMPVTRKHRAPALLGLAYALFTTACASTGGTPRPFPTTGPRPKPAEPSGRPDTSTQTKASDHDLIGIALALRGVPYKNGGTDRTGFDCSGFTQFVFAQYGLPLPRDVQNQFKVGKPVDRKELEPGDLIFFTTTEPGASHVGIAVGSDSFVHAPSTSGVVRVERFDSKYWATRFIGGRRVLSD